MYTRVGRFLCRCYARQAPAQDPPERIPKRAKTPAFANVYAYEGAFDDIRHNDHYVTYVICSYVKNLKKQCVCACIRVPPSGDTQQNVAIGPPLLLKITQDGRKMAARWSKMAHDGSRWPEVAQDGLKLAPRWPQDGSQGGLGGGFRSMTSYKSEQLTINTCEHNVDIGFKPL